MAAAQRLGCLVWSDGAGRWRSCGGARTSTGSLPSGTGYVNRAIPDNEFDSFVDRFARRVSTFDRQALADIKQFVNNVSLPADGEFPPQMDAFWRAVARPALQARASNLFELGLQQRSDVELRLGEYVGQVAEAYVARVAETQLPPASANPRSGS